MSLGFNLSTKKEDVSTKLKAQNLKRAKQETRKLEHEGKKMEERLVELKMAMNREKEERERQGGGFWKSGQTGTLNNYAEEVLTKKKKSSSSSKTKIKVLRDTPLDLPERNNQPGTMAYIAQKGSGTPRDRPRGPKCGQCEERGAAVTCVQCSEDYCAGCFAAFHLKGNLKKHRSIPISTTPRQCFASPRPAPASTSSSYDSTVAEGGVAPFIPNSAGRKDRNSPEGASGSFEVSSLLNGSYDEAEQAASFQEALQAWRNGKAANHQPSPRRTPTPRRPVVSPVRTPRVNVDSATGTVPEKVQVEIKFNTSGLSYADRLLLKKHRRTDVEALFTPRTESSGAPHRLASPASSHTSQQPLKIEEFNESDFNDVERVDFHSLFEAVVPDAQHQETPYHTDTLSIVEVQGSSSNLTLDQTSSFMVQEVGEPESWMGNKDRDSRVEAKPPASSQGRRRSGRKSSRKMQNTASPNNLITDGDFSTKSSKISQKLDDQTVTESPSQVLSSRLNDIENSLRKRQQDRLFKSEDTERPVSVKSGVSAKSIPPKSAKSRPQSGKTQPRSGPSRPSSARKEADRAVSRQSARASSRASSRIGSARSRIDHPGLLTKGPSEGLTSVARMTLTSLHQYQGGESIFLLGVEPAAEQGDRTLTPTKHKAAPTADEKYRISNQLYSMAPQSWKPDFSLAEAVPVEELDNDEAMDDRASSVMAYHMYSEQMVTEMTDRLVSRFGELPLQDDDQMSSVSAAGLGEEYRAQSVMSARDSPTPRAVSRLTQENFKSEPGVSSPRMSARGVRAQTPRASGSRSAVFRSEVQRSSVSRPRSSASRTGSQTPRRSHQAREDQEPDRPLSRAIVMEGTDLSIFDEVGVPDQRNHDDEETLDQLEWELASESGRITAEGKISRMEVLEPGSGDSASSSLDSLRSLSRLAHDQGYDINTKLKESELEDENDIMFRHSDDEGDVKNLS